MVSLSCSIVQYSCSGYTIHDFTCLLHPIPMVDDDFNFFMRPTLGTNIWFKTIIHTAIPMVNAYPMPDYHRLAEQQEQEQE